MKQQKSKFLAVGLLCSGATSHAATVILDFGTGQSGTTYIDTGITYNRITTGAISPGTTYSDLTDISNVATLWNVNVLANALIRAGSDGEGWSGTSANAVSPFTGLSTSALSDGFYVNNNGTLTIAFSGLNDSLKYNLAAFGALSSDPATPSNFTLTVGTSASTARQSLDLDTNRTNGLAATWDSVTTNGSGQITFTVNANGGTSGFRTNLNAVRLESVPEPTSTGLLGLGAMALLVRRRR